MTDTKHTDFNAITVKVTPSFSTPDSDSEFINLAVDFAGEIATEVVNLKEKAVRKALIELGWIPPNKNRATESVGNSEALRHWNTRPTPDVDVMGLNLKELERANVERQKDWASENWSLGEWMCALSGEVGEAANKVKKVFRGDMTLSEAREDIGKELADIQTYLSIIAEKVGVDLSQATIDKFNEVSNRVGSDVFIETRTAPDKADIDAGLEALEILESNFMQDTVIDETGKGNVEIQAESLFQTIRDLLEKM